MFRIPKYVSETTLRAPLLTLINFNTSMDK